MEISHTRRTVRQSPYKFAGIFNPSCQHLGRYHRKQSQSTRLYSLHGRHSTSAMGWLRRSNFRQKDEDDNEWIVKQQVA